MCLNHGNTPDQLGDFCDEPGSGGGPAPYAQAVRGAVGRRTVLAAAVAATVPAGLWPDRAFAASRQEPLADGRLTSTTAAEAAAASVDASQNGWPVSPDPTAIGCRVYPIAGSDASLQLRSGDVATVMLYVATRLHREIEPLVRSYTAAHSFRKISGTAVYSNHASGTAMDLNWHRHPYGAANTFTPAQESVLRDILDKCRGVVRWGGDYSSTPDDMHFEINVAPGDPRLSQVARALADGAPTDRAPSTAVNLFGRTPNGLLYHRHNEGGDWTPWSRIYVPTSGVATSPSVVSLGSGDYSLYVGNTGRGVSATRYRQGSGWGGWTDRGGILAGAPTAVHTGGYTNLFGTWATGVPVQAHNRSGSWSSWFPIGPSSGRLSAPPAVATSPNGVWDAFGIGLDAKAYTMRYSPGVGWGSWRALHGSFKGGLSAVFGGSQVKVFGTGLNGVLYQTDNADGFWRQWYPVGPPAGRLASPPCAVALAGGAFEVYGIGLNGAAYVLRYSPGSGWGEWTNLGGQLRGSVSATVIR